MDTVRYIYLDLSTEGGRGERDRIRFVNKANRCYKTHGGSSPMVTVKTERIPNGWDVIAVISQIWNNKNSYLLSAVWVKTSDNWSALRGGEKIKIYIIYIYQSEPKLVLQASAGNKKKVYSGNKKRERERWAALQPNLQQRLVQTETTQLPLIWCLEEKMARCYVHRL